MSKKYYVATDNPGKATEVKEILGREGETILQKQLEGFVPPPEDGKTFQENSEKKARGVFDFICKQMNAEDLVVADDSGIIVPALGENHLGVYTKREMLKWTQENQKNETDFWNYVVKKAGEGATAYFIVAITIIRAGGEIIKIEEALEGKLTFPKGTMGFAFDPIFWYEGKTLAERTSEEKQLINPRVKALRRALECII